MIQQFHLRYIPKRSESRVSMRRIPIKERGWAGQVLEWDFSRFSSQLHYLLAFGSYLDFIVLSFPMHKMEKLKKKPSKNKTGEINLTINIYFKRLKNLLLERERRKKERERNINVCLCLNVPATQACALTGNWTCDPFVWVASTQSTKLHEPVYFNNIMVFAFTLYLHLTG